MRQFIITATVLTVGLALAGAAEAKGNRSGGNSGNTHNFTTSKPQMAQSAKPQVSKYTSGKSQSFKCYNKSYCNWSSYCWNSSYGCCFWYCPSSCCYYYWYQPACCYYPVCYLDSYPPTKFTSEETQVAQITNVNVNGQQTNQEQVGPPAGSGPVVPYKK